MVIFDTHENGKITIRLSNRTNAQMFSKYKETCDNVNARFHPDYGSQVCELDQVPEVMEALVKEGFKCAPSESVLVAIAELAARIKNDTEEGKARLAILEKRMKKTGKKLYPFQRVGVNWLVPRRRALLADQMGLGKTPQSLMALPDNAAVVVVCPNTVKNVWMKEAKVWRPDLKVYTFSGRGSFVWPNPGEIYIFNYDIVRNVDPFSPLLGKIPKGLRIIIDEAHAVKNVKAKQTQFVRGLRDVVLDRPPPLLRKKWKNVHGAIWLTTGTPLMNRPSELWSVLEAADLGEQAFGNWRNFVHLYNGTTGDAGWVWGTPLPEAPILLKRVCLMRKRADVLPDLPEKSYEDIEIDLRDKELQQRLNELSEDLSDEGIDLRSITLEDLMKEEAFFHKIARLRAELATAKIPDMLEIVENYEDNQETLVVFSAHRAPIDVLKDRDGWAVITGDTSQNDRQKIVEDFQSGKYKGLGLTIASGGVGITLTHAAHALFVDLMWTPAANLQAEDRLARIGQTRGVLIKRLVCSHSVEKLVHEKLTIKSHIIEHGVDPAATTDSDAIEYNLGFDVFKAIEKDTEDMSVINGFKKFNQILEKNNMLHKSVEEEHVQNVSKFRGPQTEQEKWAIQGILRLSGMDQDMAREQNNIGFNKLDTSIGNSIAQAYISNKKLSDAQWGVVVKIIAKYHKQVGKFNTKQQVVVGG